MFFIRPMNYLKPDFLIQSMNDSSMLSFSVPTTGINVGITFHPSAFSVDLAVRIADLTSQTFAQVLYMPGGAECLRRTRHRAIAVTFLPTLRSWRPIRH